jgi:hypothetical protein
MADTSRGRLGVAELAATTNTTVYSITDLMDAKVDITITNQSIGTPSINLAIVDGLAADIADEDYIIYNRQMAKGETIELKGLDMSADEAVVAYSALAGVVVRVSGVEEDVAGSGTVQELTASGAIAAGTQSVELTHATVAIAATIATLVAHPGLLVIKNTGTGTEDHTVTATVGTFNGTNNVITIDAHDDCIALYIDSTGNGTILANVGPAVLS